MSATAELTARRRAMRQQLLDWRCNVPADQLRAWSEAITRQLAACLAGWPAGRVGFCWPYKNEPDPRFFVHQLRQAGWRAALPEVIGKGQPLVFREWRPEVKTLPGVFDLPVPQGTEVVHPDLLLVPPVGFDARGYRLGYGGGFFDRTIAALDTDPVRLALAFEGSRIDSIDPQSWDIPMELIVTEAGIYQAGGEPLKRIDAAAAGAYIRSRLARSPAPAANDETLRLLNTLLEAERAGAKVIAAYMTAYSEDSDAWKQLQAVQRDEANNCAILIRLIRHLGGTPSSATGAFLEKALAVQDPVERLKFLNRGQEWVARQIDRHLETIVDTETRQALAVMLESHRDNIALCDRLID